MARKRFEARLIALEVGNLFATGRQATAPPPAENKLPAADMLKALGVRMPEELM